MRHTIHHLLSTIYVCALLLPVAAVAQSDTASDTTAARDYAVYTRTGAPATLDDIVAAMDTASVVFVGEQHDDSVAHALELELLERAHARFKADPVGRERPLVLSLEMFERDVQPVLDEYLDSLISERHFLAAARPWGNYADYRPLVEFARTYDVPVLAANAPRRYVNRVARIGRESLADLPPSARAALPPLPYPGPTAAYRDKWIALMSEAAHGSTDDGEMDTANDTTEASPSPHHGHGAGMTRMLDAQALWDAAMAYTVAQQLMAAPDALVLHVAGAFHVEGGLGTPAQLRTYRPGTPTLVVTLHPADDVDAFDADEHAGLGDFVVLTDGGTAR